MNMRNWVAQTIQASHKKPLPLLSFPCVQLMGISVKELIGSSDLQAQGMALVASRVDSAAAVSLMDLSLEAEAFGASIHVSREEVPTVVGALVVEPEDADALAVPPVGAGRTGIYLDAIGKCGITDRPVLAGIIGPFSLAGRLLDVSEAMILCYEEPEMVHTVLEKATAFLIDYCKAYQKAGANGVVMAEPLAGLLSPKLAKEFSHPYVKRIIDAVQQDDFAVIYHNCGDNAARMAGDIYRLGAMGYHFGDAIDLMDVLPDAPADALVMGNISPSAKLLGGTPESVAEAVRKLRQSCGAYPNFVLSSGCDIPPKTPWENLDAFFRAAN